MYICEVDVIVYVLWCFEDEDIIYVDGWIDLVVDVEIVEIEFMFVDLESLENWLLGLEKKVKGNDKEVKKLIELIE